MIETIVDLRLSSDKDIRSNKRALISGVRKSIDYWGKEKGFNKAKVVRFKWSGGKGQGCIGYVLEVDYELTT